jgi:hypothetical protein
MIRMSVLLYLHNDLLEELIFGHWSGEEVE